MPIVYGFTLLFNIERLYWMINDFNLFGTIFAVFINATSIVEVILMKLEHEKGGKKIMLFSLLFTVALIIGLLFLLSIGIEVIFYLILLGIAGMLLFSFGGALTVMLYFLIKVLMIVLVVSIVVGILKVVMNTILSHS